VRVTTSLEAGSTGRLRATLLAAATGIVSARLVLRASRLVLPLARGSFASE
jgi:hypothetical protein